MKAKDIQPKVRDFVKTPEGIYEIQQPLIAGKKYSEVSLTAMVPRKQVGEMYAKFEKACKEINA